MAPDGWECTIPETPWTESMPELEVRRAAHRSGGRGGPRRSLPVSRRARRPQIRWDRPIARKPARNPAPQAMAHQAQCAAPLTRCGRKIGIDRRLRFRGTLRPRKDLLAFQSGVELQSEPDKDRPPRDQTWTVDSAHIGSSLGRRRRSPRAVGIDQPDGDGLRRGTIAATATVPGMEPTRPPDSPRPWS